MSTHPLRQHARPVASGTAPLSLTDSANARKLIEIAGDALRYLPDAKRWLIRDDTTNLWSYDEDGGTIRLAQRAALEWHKDAAVTTDLEQQKRLADHAMRSQNRAKLKDAIELAKSEHGITIAPAALDAHPWLLSVRNGVVDLRSGELRKRRADDLMSKMAAARYVPDAECPRFQAFLLDVMDDRPELVDFLQRLFGYALFGGNPEQVLAIFVGAGANGKSTVLSVMLDILADYARTTPADTFLHRQEGAASNDLARLHGARFVSATEAEANRRLAENLVKRLTGGDRIAARYLFAEYFEFVPAFLAFLAVNHRPIVSGDDPAIWRRLLVIPFDRVIPPDRREPHLIQTLLEERDGILGWMVRGCVAWQRAGLSVPQACMAAAGEYRDSMDSFGAWIADRCVEAAGLTTAAGRLYADFVEWCCDSDQHAISSVKFAAKLKERGCTKEKTSSANVYRGIGLTQP